MLIKQIYDEKLAQYSYLIGCQATKEAIVIDPERYIDRYIEIANEENVKIIAVADTHIHADYLSGMREFAERQGVMVYASDEGEENTCYKWLKHSNYNYRLLKDKDRFKIGNIEFSVMHTPGHTPEHISFLVYDKNNEDPVGIITGDFVFVGDVGRPDLLESAAGLKGVMEPSARILYKSIQRFKLLPEFLQIWPAHGAGSACGKALGAIPHSTVGYELRYNSSIKEAHNEDNFVDYILSGQPEPPRYFAAMKRINTEGPPVWGKIPDLKEIGVSELSELAGRTDMAILDTRSKEDFMEGHIPGSILTTMAKSFPTMAGSYVEENMPVYLIIEKSRLREAIIDLIDIGIDNIKGYAEPDIIKKYKDLGHKLKVIEKIDFKNLKNKTVKDGLILDVRKKSEYDEGHLTGSLNIAHTRLLTRKDEVPADKKLFIHCSRGGRAATAVSVMARYGHNVIFVDGDFTN